MTILLIGHRGVGKTTFLESLKDFARQQEISCQLIDLDQEIEGETGLSITDLWRDGEAAFREREVKTLNKILERPLPSSETRRIVALGAGFEGPMPEGVHVIWLRRETDRDGRVFLNRPRLNSQGSAFDEYLERFHVREKRYREWALEQLFLPEGYTRGLEAFVLQEESLSAPFALTLKPSDFRDWEMFLAKRTFWNLKKFELRDDLLSPEQIKLARQTVPADQLLYAVRVPGQPSPVDLESDWPLELGVPKGEVEIISRHERSVDLQDTINELTLHHAEILKLAVPIANFAELELGHNWWLRDPKRRAFLPRSADGRWRWYRSLFGPRMPLHFIREDEGSAADQPLFWQTQLQAPLVKNFAAVLGHPVHHSRSPLEHQDFFRGLQMPFVSIDLSAEEFPQAFDFLIRLGLTHAAVTSPLKEVAFKACDLLTLEAEALRSVNTLHIQKRQVAGHNTDVLALQAVKEDFLPSEKVWLWGGGGIRTSVLTVWPQAIEISARNGRIRGSGVLPSGEVDLLIWAAGRSRDFKWPDASVRAKQIFDLNYGDNSPGLEWACTAKLPYQSGLKMFKLQADFQRQFWQGTV